MEVIMEDDFDADDMDNWIYFEEDVFLADELAETQIPDPGYAEGAFEMMMEYYDYDDLTYWDDVDYGNDEYWDGAIDALSGQRRGQTRTKAVNHGHKRRKVSLKETDGDNVRFRSLSRRLHKWMEPGRISDSRTSFALLPNWREQLANASGALGDIEMPEDMLKAAEGATNEFPEVIRQPYAAGTLDEDDEDSEDENAENLLSELASLDPETLKAILKHKLGAAGLGGIDESAFIQSITKMLSGEGGADEAVGELAHSLLGQAAEGNDTALSGWLSQQGVSLGEEGEAENEDDDEADKAKETSVALEGGSNGAERDAQVEDDTLTSPHDSVLELAKGADHSEIDVESHWHKPNMSTRKRAAPDHLSDDANKRKKVTFDTSSSSGSKLVLEDDKAIGLRKDTRDRVQAQATMPGQDAAESKAKMQTASAINGTAAKTTRRRYDDATTSSTSKSKSNKEPDDREVQATNRADSRTKPTAAVAGTARKRKAQSDADDCDCTAPLQKKHVCETSKAAAGSSGTEGKRTRSTRSDARSGK